MSRAAHHQRRRGTVYLHVLAVATIVAVIGLASVRLGRLGLRDQTTAADTVQARLLADSVLQIVVAELNDDADWRTTYDHGEWQPPRKLAVGRFSFMLEDETDQDLENDPADPVRLHIRAGTSGAIRCVSVELTELSERTEVNIIDNPGFESGAANWTRSILGSFSVTPDRPYEGANAGRLTSRILSADGIKQTVTDDLENGARYQISAFVRSPDGAQTASITLAVFSTDRPLGEYLQFTGPVGTDWTEVTGTLTTTWSGGLNLAEFAISTTGRNEFHVDSVRAIKRTDVARLVPTRGSWRDEPLDLTLADGDTSDGLEVDLGILKINLN